MLIGPSRSTLSIQSFLATSPERKGKINKIQQKNGSCPRQEKRKEKRKDDQFCDQSSSSLVGDADDVMAGDGNHLCLLLPLCVCDQDDPTSSSRADDL